MRQIRERRSMRDEMIFWGIIVRHDERRGGNKFRKKWNKKLVITLRTYRERYSLNEWVQQTRRRNIFFYHSLSPLLSMTGWNFLIPFVSVWVKRDSLILSLSMSFFQSKSREGERESHIKNTFYAFIQHDVKRRSLIIIIIIFHPVMRKGEKTMCLSLSYNTVKINNSSIWPFRSESPSVSDVRSGFFAVVREMFIMIMMTTEIIMIIWWEDGMMVMNLTFSPFLPPSVRSSPPSESYQNY